jgi:hypothetical protein
MSVPNQRELAAEEQLLNERRYQDLRPSVIEFIKRLRHATATEEWVHLHRDLLIEFGSRQDAADEVLPTMRREARDAIAELAKNRPKPVVKIAAQQEILDRVARLERVEKAGQHTLRQIADGIAWRALRYDRRTFTILGEGERVGRLASGVGREAELALLGELWEEASTFAIHNDMTNCIRHGDLTAIKAQGRAIDINLIEVKAGQRPDDTPQLRRLERATSLLREGRQVTDEGVVHVTVVPAVYETYLDILPELISTARRFGHAWMRPHDCMLVGAVDYSVWGRDAQIFSARSDAERRRIGWGGDEPDTLAWMASMRRMRDRKYAFSSLAPYTIFPLPTEDVADLVMGFIDVSCSLKLTGLEQALSRNGISVQVARPGPAQSLFLEASRGRIGLEVPPHLREQMMVELMTPNALFAAIEHVLEVNEAKPGERNDRRVVAFRDEAAVWESRTLEQESRSDSDHV